MFIMETPIKMDDLGVPLFLETTPVTLLFSAIYKGPITPFVTIVGAPILQLYPWGPFF